MLQKIRNPLRKTLQLRRDSLPSSLDFTVRGRRLSQRDRGNFHTLLTHTSTQAAIWSFVKWYLIFKDMWRTGFLLICVIVVGAVCDAQTVTLTLLEDLSSKLPTGTEFTARDAAGKIYHGHVVTHRARFLLRRGSMRLVFDDPIVPVT